MGKRSGAMWRFAMAMVLIWAAGSTPAAAQDRAAAYASMGPVEAYLTPRAEEIDMARSAAPPAISDDATVMVLTRSGYSVATKGKNGFVCLVERSWMSPFDFPEFWNPRMRGPVCYNPQAVRTILPDTVKRTDLALAGASKALMRAKIEDAVARHELAAPAPGAMSYMMSRKQYLNDEAEAWAPHLMFYVPTADAAAWGANLPRSPIMLDTDHTDTPELISTFMMTAPQWSDGTPYAHGQGHGH
jgi:hypothetical protein